MCYYHVISSEKTSETLENEINKNSSLTFPLLPVEESKFPQRYYHIIEALESELGFPVEEYQDYIDDSNMSDFFHQSSSVILLPERRVIKRKCIREIIEQYRMILLLKDKKKRGTISDGYETIKRLKMLCILIEKKKTTTEEMSLLSCVSKRRVRDAMKWMKNKGYVECVLDGCKHVWRVLKGGLVYFFDTGWTFLQCDLLLMKSSTHCKNVHPTISYIRVLIEEAEKIIQLLQRKKDKGGWETFPRTARSIFKDHKVAYVMARIRSIQKKTHIENPGGYLYSILYKKSSKKNRINSLINRVLDKLSSDVKAKFLELAQNLEPKEFARLAFILQKKQKDMTVTIGDLQGICGWIIKQRKDIQLLPAPKTLSENEAIWREEKVKKAASNLFKALLENV